MIALDDDAIVVGMAIRRSTWSYLDEPETLRRRELEYGMVREPPAPFYDHQAVVTNLVALLAPRVRARALGRLCVSPIDVVLDADHALIVQPDAVFISTPRLGIIRDQIWGAPDLVVEVLSPGTMRRDRTRKLAWYRRYGVREYWLVDPKRHTVDVVRLAAAGERIARRRIRGRGLVVSTVLPDLGIRASDLFA